ncbi:MAG: hypothetical protein ACKO4K_00770 [Flavobacteriales bacterium]
MKFLLSLQRYIILFIETKLSAVRMIFQSRFFGIVASVNPNKPLLILGNGPSLNVTLQENSADSLRFFDLMAVNNAANAELFTTLKPRYYLLNAVTYFQPDEELNDYYIDQNKELYANLEQKTTWKMTLLLPFRAKQSLAVQGLLASHATIDAAFFNQTPIEGLSFWTKFGYRWGWGMPRPHNVLIPSLMVGARLGYTKMVIVGADHSWLSDLTVNENNESLLRHVHFYDTEGSQPMKVEDRINRPRRLHEILHKFYLSFSGYWQIKSFAETEGICIYNASKVSMIDAFERKRMAEILETNTDN